jgi:beta-aspartyl-peptidase (threonine type)
MSDHRWSIIVHGGAGRIAPERESASRAGCLAAVAAGASILAAGGAALAAVEQAVRVLEDDPTFNAGYGSVLNAAGEVEMDAAIMDGATLDLGGVAAAKGLRHPISVAAAMLDEPTTLLAGAGAAAFAMRVGAELVPPDELIAPRRRRPEEAKDTVGCVAFDRYGNLAAGTSTGGIGGKPVGRIGDSPLPGCGLYAENGAGGVSLSGDGELISRQVLGARILADMAQSDVDLACERSMARIAAMGGSAGVIALDAQGRAGFAHNSPSFAVAWRAQDALAAAFQSREEARAAGWEG